MPSRVLTLLSAVALAAACTTDATHWSTSESINHVIGRPDRSNATPSLATSGDRVVLAWSATATGTPTEILVAVSDDGGRSFGSPVRVNDSAAEARASGEQAPRVAITAREIAVLWTARREMKSEVRLSRSTDGARTFAASSPVHADGLTGARGWASLAADDAGRLHALWLDGRNAEVAPAHQHQHQATSAKTPPGAATSVTAAPRAAPQQDLYRATIESDGRVTEARVASAVCFCCKTAVITRGDRVLTAWRHIYPESLRDMAFADLGPTGPPDQPIVRVSEDGWKIEACPDDGPAMATGTDGRVHIVWPTVIPGPTPTKGIFYASSADARSFAPRERLDAGPSSAHPQIVSAGSHGIVAAWDESAKGLRRIVIRRRAPGAGAAWSAPELLEHTAAGVYPALGVSSDALIIAWTSQTEPNSTIVVRRLPWR